MELLIVNPNRANLLLLIEIPEVMWVTASLRQQAKVSLAPAVWSPGYAANFFSYSSLKLPSRVYFSDL
ncbi:hypothetical protein L1D34_17820 [Vibrio mediterranei]|uniref:hypothetical protein n=1 Tax=Vibrio mediterranei TaxID=689 RepID=UPI001EFC7291|nr:hypothetical protein [Vibrio mediterranei]MCG9626690.1 hypothetical protein [Vibrio mediterranei]